jgi:CMP-N-acetylneuraminic acid synthetase
MKVIAFLPLKEKSLRLENKNILDLSGQPLFNHMLYSLSQVSELSKICIFSSSEFYKKYLTHENKSLFQHIQRPKKLDRDDCTINEVIREFINVEEADIYVLAHATSPLLGASSIKSCVNAVLSGKYDSAFPANLFFKFAQFQGKPLNYDINQELKPTSELEPVVIEQGGLYVFTKQLVHTHNRRVGNKPFVLPINFPESIDIDYKFELDLARKLYEN